MGIWSTRWLQPWEYWTADGELVMRMDESRSSIDRRGNHRFNSVVPAFSFGMAG